MTTPPNRKPGRKPFAINESNYRLIVDYLIAKSARTQDIVGARDVAYDMGNIRSPQDLAEWCSRHLHGKEWQQVVAAVKQRIARDKKKKAVGYQHKSQITIDSSALYVLQSIVEDNSGFGMETLSDAIHYLGEVYTNTPKKYKNPSSRVWLDYRIPTLNEKKKQT